MPVSLGVVGVGSQQSPSKKEWKVHKYRYMSPRFEKLYAMNPSSGE